MNSLDIAKGSNIGSEVLEAFGFTESDLIYSLRIEILSNKLVTVTIERHLTVEEMQKGLSAIANYKLVPR